MIDMNVHASKLTREDDILGSVGRAKILYISLFMSVCMYIREFYPCAKTQFGTDVQKCGIYFRVILIQKRKNYSELSFGQIM